MSFYTTSIHTASKPHECDECGGRILSKAQYAYSRGNHHGEFYTHRAHLLCSDLHDRLWDDYGDEDGMLVFDTLQGEVGKGNPVIDAMVKEYNAHAATCGGRIVMVVQEQAS